MRRCVEELLFVLLLIILGVLPGLDALPPRFIISVPLDRQGNPLVKGMEWLPAEVIVDLAPVDGVATIMTWAVFDILDSTLKVDPHHITDFLDYFFV